MVDISRTILWVDTQHHVFHTILNTDRISLYQSIFEISAKNGISSQNLFGLLSAARSMAILQFC